MDSYSLGLGGDDILIFALRSGLDAFEIVPHSLGQAECARVFPVDNGQQCTKDAGPFSDRRIGPVRAFIAIPLISCY